MKELDPGYSYEADNIGKDAWHSLMLQFDDASFYQTWSYGAVSWGEDKLSHLILKKDDIIVSAAQLRIARLPLLPVGLAYAPWAPMWRRKNEHVDCQHLRNMLGALYNEYAIRRGYQLRIVPRQICDGEADVRQIFEGQGFSWTADPQETVYVDLTPSLEEIRKNLGSGWKKTLRRAMNIDLELIEDDDNGLNYRAIQLISEMKQRKGFVEFGSMENNILINNDLPVALRMKLVLCKFENEIVAVLGWSRIGDIGMPLVSATGNKASKSLAPHRLYWKMIEYYKGHGLSRCDLAGINRVKNPGGHYFKKGLAGETGLETHYVGQFDACDSWLSSGIFRTGMQLRTLSRELIVDINSWWRRLKMAARNTTTGDPTRAE